MHNASNSFQNIFIWKQGAQMFYENIESAEDLLRPSEICHWNVKSFYRLYPTQMRNHHEKHSVQSSTQFNDFRAQNCEFLFIRISQNVLGGTQQFFWNLLEIEISKNFIFIFIPHRFKSEINYNKKLHWQNVSFWNYHIKCLHY